MRAHPNFQQDSDWTGVMFYTGSISQDSTTIYSDSSIWKPALTLAPPITQYPINAHRRKDTDRLQDGLAVDVMPSPQERGFAATFLWLARLSWWVSVWGQAVFGQHGSDTVCCPL